MIISLAWIIYFFSLKLHILVSIILNLYIFERDEKNSQRVTQIIGDVSFSYFQTG